MDKKPVVSVFTVVADLASAFNQIHFAEAETADNFPDWPRRPFVAVQLDRGFDKHAAYIVRLRKLPAIAEQWELLAQPWQRGTVDDIDEIDHQYAQVAVIQPPGQSSQRSEADITLKRRRKL